MEEEIVGMFTGAMYTVPTRTTMVIEDVVVDTAHRGKGYGMALTKFGIEWAKRHGADTVDLTSRESRAAANQMYRQAGFEARDTNVYRYTLSR